MGRRGKSGFKFNRPQLPAARFLQILKYASSPSLSANPFRELRNRFCRLPLPTFMHNTIGCSPWRPEAVYSTVEMDEYCRLSFHGRGEGSSWKTQGLPLLKLKPILPVIRFLGLNPHQSEKRTHFTPSTLLLNNYCCVTT